MTTKEKVTEWIQSVVHNLISAKPMLVNIGGQEYAGCLYSINRQDTKCKTYTEERLYLVGEIPRCYAKVKKARTDYWYTPACFRLPGDDRDWFIAAWNPDDVVPEDIRQFHPFGKWFTLSPWTHGSIDEHEPVKRTRIEVKLLETQVNV